MTTISNTQKTYNYVHKVLISEQIIYRADKRKYTKVKGLWYQITAMVSSQTNLFSLFRLPAFILRTRSTNIR